MDQFELARQKTAEREARKARYAKAEQAQNIASFVPARKDEDVSVHATQVIKEKLRKNGIFTISVDMPHAQFTFSLVKQSILSHAPQSRLTESEIRRHIVQGLKPLIGGLD
jgi:hypothetical protein